ncbi:MAG TPA: hypothetical protein VGO81_06290, partial [Solirubrobacteraceae bacterium]|nr:hypothetical protein [Solirubrobacteraceae bacterium]
PGDYEAVWCQMSACRVLRRRLTRRVQLVHSRSRAKTLEHDRQRHLASVRCGARRSLTRRRWVGGRKPLG